VNVAVMDAQERMHRAQHLLKRPEYRRRGRRWLLRHLGLTREDDDEPRDASCYNPGMCGRFVIKNPGAAIERFGWEKLVENRLPLGLPQLARFNIAPTQDVLVVVPPRPDGSDAPPPAPGDRLTVLVDGPDGRQLRLMRWGYEPAWMAERGIGKPQINARAETLEERSMFRGALARRRCLILADGFYEWRAVPGRKRKQPLHVQLEGGRPFGFAGIFTRAEDGELTCAIITCEPNALMAEIHHRMPAILRPEHEDAWLDPEMTDPPALASMLRPYPAEEMEAYPVSDAVNSSRAEGEQLALPLA
jgi:putative SOS response-associated peptidase YedK